MNSATTVSFSATMKLLTVADSLIPTTSTNDMIATIAIAGRFTMDPVEFRPAVPQPATPRTTSDASHHRNGAEVSAAGRWMLTFSSRPTKYPDQPTPTVDAPIAYSRTRSQPMIHAMNSPIVAYAYVYALPATGTAL